MFEEDLQRWKMHLDGEPFVWDTISYPSESKFLSRNI